LLAGDSSGGCDIATATYGSYVAPDVIVLREFRDKVLMPHTIRKYFITFYYKISLPIANFISKHDYLKTIVRWGLLPTVLLSKAMLNFGIAFSLETNNQSG
jgi:pilus assembly protein TadC